MKKMIILLMVFALALTASAVHAVVKTSDVIVTTAVVANCVVSTTQQMSFPDYDPTSGTDTTAEAIVSITCTSGTSYDTYLGYDTGDTAREMKDITDTYALPYEVYKEGTWTTTYPVTNPSSPTVAPDNNALLLTLFGKIPAGTDVPVAAYDQTLKFTIEY